MTIKQRALERDHLHIGITWALPPRDRLLAFLESL